MCESDHAFVWIQSQAKVSLFAVRSRVSVSLRSKLSLRVVPAVRSRSGLFGTTKSTFVLQFLNRSAGLSQVFAPLSNLPCSERLREHVFCVLDSRNAPRRYVPMATCPYNQVSCLNMHQLSTKSFQWKICGNFSAFLDGLA